MIFVEKDQSLNWHFIRVNVLSFGHVTSTGESPEWHFLQKIYFICSLSLYSPSMAVGLALNLTFECRSTLGNLHGKSATILQNYREPPATKKSLGKG